MRIERTGVAIAAVLGGLVGIQPALGQDSDRVTVDVGDCVDLASREERLACYESQVDAALQERPAPMAGEQAGRPAAAEPPPAGTTAAGAEVAASSAATRSGEAAASTSASPGRADDVRSEERAAEPREFTGTIKALRPTVPNSWLITLDNGQVWRQMRPEWYPLRPGQTVRIYSTTWGSAFRLSAEGLSGFIQVERAN